MCLNLFLGLKIPSMTKKALEAFIVEAKNNASMQEKLREAGPEEIIRIAADHGFDFSDEIKGRFINRWHGVYHCPQREHINELCPRLVPEGFSSLGEYSQSTCSTQDKQESHNFREGEKYC